MVGEHSADKWPGIIAKMQKRAGLQQAERDAVLAYLLAASGTN
ncbi:MAG: hypothetical protein ABR526_04500 [Chthoniobacterales bacterium]